MISDQVNESHSEESSSSDENQLNQESTGNSVPSFRITSSAFNKVLPKNKLKSYYDSLTYLQINSIDIHKNITGFKSASFVKKTDLIFEGIYDCIGKGFAELRPAMESGDLFSHPICSKPLNQNINDKLIKTNCNNHENLNGTKCSSNTNLTSFHNEVSEEKRATLAPLNGVVKELMGSQDLPNSITYNHFSQTSNLLDDKNKNDYPNILNSNKNSGDTYFSQEAKSEKQSERSADLSEHDHQEFTQSCNNENSSKNIKNDLSNLKIFKVKLCNKRRIKIECKLTQSHELNSQSGSSIKSPTEPLKTMDENCINSSMDASKQGIAEPKMFKKSDKDACFIRSGKSQSISITNQNVRYSNYPNKNYNSLVGELVGTL